MPLILKFTEIKDKVKQEVSLVALKVVLTCLPMHKSVGSSWVGRSLES